MKKATDGKTYCVPADMTYREWEKTYVKDVDKSNTAVVLKTIADGDNHLKLVLRLHTSADPGKYSNSIITFMRIDEKTERGLLRNKKVLYKHE